MEEGKKKEKLDPAKVLKQADEILMKNHNIPLERYYGVYQVIYQSPKPKSKAKIERIGIPVLNKENKMSPVYTMKAEEQLKEKIIEIHKHEEKYKNIELKEIFPTLGEAKYYQVSLDHNEENE
jgi:hypothetical protein